MNTALFFFAGIVGGLLGGMGMGGGTLLIPILSVLLNVEQHTAQTVNLVSFIPTAVIALIIHAKNKMLDKKGTLPVVISAIIFTAVFSYLSTLIQSQLLKRFFGCFLIIFGIVQFVLFIMRKRNDNCNT